MWLQRAAVEAFRILLPGTVGFTLANLLLIALVNLGEVVPWWGISLLLPLLLTLSGVAASLFSIALKWIVMGRYTPKERPLWSPFVWGSELVTIVCESLGGGLAGTLRGTPFICWYFRLLGSKIGKRVYMDTTDITEHDLVEIGDDVALDEDCTIQTHLFEDRVMKMSYVRIGNRCSIGASALVLYDTHMSSPRLFAEEMVPARERKLAGWRHRGQESRPFRRGRAPSAALLGTERGTGKAPANQQRPWCETAAGIPTDGSPYQAEAGKRYER